MNNASKSPYIASKWFDYSFFIYIPIIALLLGYSVEGLSLILEDSFSVFKKDETNPFYIFGSTLTLSHLFLVFFRSHLNGNIFKQFPIRFTIIPLTFFITLTINPYWFAFWAIVTTWWDVYHSSLQTFGLGRIYDGKIGNDPNLGRRMDYFLNLFLYIGPIIGGVSFIDHIISDLKDWRLLSKVIFDRAPEFLVGNLKWFALTMGIITILFLVFYIYHFKQLKSLGYNYPKLKLALYISTGITSIISWGLNPFGDSFFIMNFFHAIQYYALVYLMEKKNLAQIFKIDKKNWKNVAILGILIITSLSYGVLTEANQKIPPGIYLLSFYTTVSIMHFWYDGFIWSVRKKHV
jgi:hypothetical protein